jgi:hypothetical protein
MDSSVRVPGVWCLWAKYTGNGDQGQGRHPEAITTTNRAHKTFVRFGAYCMHLTTWRSSTEVVASRNMTRPTTSAESTMNA